MILLTQELIKFFKTNTDLKYFLPTFKYLLNYNVFPFKKNKNPNKTYNKKILYKNNNFEIILINWGNYSESPIHCHPKNGCLLTILDGELIEERYNKDKLIKTNILKKNDFEYIHCKIGKHKIINPNNKNVYSLHIYSPPGYYD